ncbi:MAG TPA: pilus assembly protein TadG-related protein [Thermoanaerobaculia bacterium]|nr:pilus assembly protein TadG-related protein [Thermoanaerobaculia bacterium]
MTTNAELTIRPRGKARGRPSEEGQVLVLFLLILITMVLIGVVAVAVGQTLVRRQHAQMIVDAAAFAGASSQARGMNTIARMNEKELHLLQGIELSMAVPYVDNFTITAERYFAILVSPILPPLVSDWAGTVIEDYQNIFGAMNSYIKAVNFAYSPGASLANLNFLFKSPGAAAKETVLANFSGSDTLFRNEDPADYGMIKSASLFSHLTELVELTDPQEYGVGGYNYLFYPTFPAVDTCPCTIIPITYPCCQLLAAYGITDFYYFTIRPFVDQIKFKLGRFYKNNQSEVRFAYYLKVKNTPAIFGRNVLNDVPEITVVAAAKPYGGYLGDEFKYFAGISQAPVVASIQGDKEIAYTYKAKLVPINAGERAGFITTFGADLSNPKWWVLH